MNLILRNTAIGLAITTAAAAAFRPVSQKINDLRDDNMLQGAAIYAAQDCAERMVGGARHGIIDVEFPRCNSLQKFTLSNGLEASITYGDSFHSRDTHDNSLYDDNSHSIHDRIISFPTGAYAEAIVTVKGREEPVRAKARFDQTTAWDKCTHGWGICEGPSN